MCRVFEVSRSGYYEWLSREPSERAQFDEHIGQKIEQHFHANREVYGTRRLKRALADEDDLQVSRRRIGRLMTERGLRVKTRRTFKAPRIRLTAKRSPLTS